MEMITKNPGFQHISENIFRLLDKKSLTDCRLVNSLWKSLVDRQTFWLRKLNTENPKSDVRRSWDNLIQELDEDDQLEMESVLILLIKIFEIKQNRPLKVAFNLGESKKYPDLIKFILEHENASSKTNLDTIPVKYGSWIMSFKAASPIHLASLFGFKDVVKKLLTKKNPDEEGFTDISNYLDGSQNTPIHYAALNGHLKTLKYLVSMTNTPIFLNSNRETPIHFAAIRGHLDTLKYLVNLTASPIATNYYGWTALHEAARAGHLDILKYLVHLTDNPNAPLEKSGMTPIDLAMAHRHDRVAKFLEEYRDQNWILKLVRTRIFKLFKI